MKKILLLIIILLFVKISYASISFNEIMYNPQGDDNNKEFIEIYMDLPVDLSNYMIQDAKEDDKLELIKDIGGNYALIVEEGFNHENINASIYSVGKTIGNSLNNDQDVLILKDPEGNILDVLKYYSTWGANGNGYSLEFRNNNWLESFNIGGSPGKENFQSINIDFSSIKINEFLPDPVGYDDASMPNGEFIELYNPKNEDLNLEGLEFHDAFNHKLIISNTTTLTGTIIQANGYLVVYTNGISGFLNNEDLETISLYYQNILIDKVSYGSSQEGISWSNFNGIWKKTFPTPNSLNLENSNLIEPAIKIEKVYLGNDKEASFGDTVDVRVIVYKGNSTKENIELWVEDEYKDYISKKTKFLADIKFYNYTLTLPLQILPNCDNKFQDGEYTLRLEGLDLSDEKEIDIYGLNEEVCKQAVSETSKKELEFEIVSVEEKNNELIIKVKITNNKESENLKIWSYIYRGSKSYSGEREENLKEIRVKEKSSEEIELKNSIEDIPPGDYNLKIKLLKEGTKTPKELTNEITIEQTVFSNQEEENFESNINQTSSSVMYESSTMKSRKYAIYFFNAILVILLIEMIRKK